MAVAIIEMAVQLHVIGRLMGMHNIVRVNLHLIYQVAKTLMHHYD